MKKKIILTAIWSVFAVGVFILMGFAQRAHNNLVCKKLNIEIKRSANQLFVMDDDLHNLLKDHGYAVEGQPMSAVDVNRFEKLIATHPAVESVDVFASVNGEVNVKAVQRRPVVRIINNKDETFYIDDKGKLMPWSENYTAPVLFVNGFIYDTYGAMYNYDMRRLENDTVIGAITPLDEIYRLAMLIDRDTFLTNQVVQLSFTLDKRFEITPRVGNHKIIFGSAENAEEKFKKLKSFYTEGLNSTGNWNRYSVINLEYKNQVVCTRRPL
jgi:cell division protein FtsQ